MLKRETTIFRLLSASIGEDGPFARIIDWNFETPPFFIECDDAGEDLLRLGSDAGSTFDERLELVSEIAAAVAAVHETGVLHKDLKPANVLISTDGGRRVVRLVDFGSSGVHDRDRLDAFGVTPLGLTLDGEGSGRSTPLYMAPEIVAGQAHTIRSDIYALGVLAYQVLAGDMKKPLTTGWEEDIADPLLREDIARATAGDPERRFASAADFEASLQSLEARRHAAAAAAADEARYAEAQASLNAIRARRPWVYATGAVLAAGLATSLFLARSADTARQEAVMRTAQAEAANGFLQDIILSADPRTPGVGPDASVRDALARASDTVAERFDNDVQTQLFISSALIDVYNGLADFDAEVSERDRRLTLLKRLHGETAPQTIQERYQLAEALIRASRYDEAEAMIAEADQQASNPGIEGAETRLRAAIAKGRLALVQLDFQRSADQYSLAKALLPEAAPDDLVLRHAIDIDLAQGLSRLGQTREAAEILGALVEPPFTEGVIPDWRLARTRMIYGAALLYDVRPDDAEPVLLQAIEELESIYGEDAPQVAEARGVLSQAYADMGQWPKALEERVFARKAACDSHGHDHVACLLQIGNEGVARIETGDIAGAIENLTVARNGFIGLMGETSPAVQVMGYQLAAAHLEGGDLEAVSALLPTLTVEGLEAGAPSTQWRSRLDALQGSYLVRSGSAERGRELLARAISNFHEEKADEALIARHERDL
ncbi:protein kinase domain-containing protein [Parvularcula lutaonensis]|uniref:Protein kinase n=1 Tax=Parvularcula lutaonensis TaxID=491923 RepID=A0ABV7MA72_9PROT|nr:protein kinase [Parvularcula lutaonensis]